MGFAWVEFRCGVENNRKLNARPRQNDGRCDLAPLIARTQEHGKAMGPATPIEALIRIEGDSWMFERADPSALAAARHRIVVHETARR